MRRHLLIGACAIPSLVASGCGGDGEATKTTQSMLPAAAPSAMDERLASGIARSLWMFANLESRLAFMAVPRTALAPGIRTTAGPTADVVGFDGTFDDDGDGFAETTVSATASVADDPGAGRGGVDGQANFDVALPNLGDVYHANVRYEMRSDERRLVGAATYTDPSSGDVSTVAVDPSSPLVIRVADRAAGLASNACGYNLSGRVAVQVSGASGVLMSSWSFSPTSPRAKVEDATFRDVRGQVVAIPDATLDLRCG